MLSPSLIYVYNEISRSLNFEAYDPLKKELVLGVYECVVDPSTFLHGTPYSTKLVINPADSATGQSFCAIYVETAITNSSSNGPDVPGQATDLSNLIRLIGVEKRPLLVHDLISVLGYQTRLKFTNKEALLAPSLDEQESLRRICEAISHTLECSDWFRIVQMSINFSIEADNVFYLTVDTMECSTSKKFSFSLRIALSSSGVNDTDTVQQRACSSLDYVIAPCHKLTDFLLSICDFYCVRKKAQELMQACTELGIPSKIQDLVETNKSNLSKLRIDLVGFDSVVYLETDLGSGLFSNKSDPENWVKFTIACARPTKAQTQQEYLTTKENFISFAGSHLTHLYSF